MEPDQLASYVLESCQEEEDFHFLAFEALQRQNIVRLQNKLAEFKTRIRKGEHAAQQDEELQKVLHSYVDAIRDYSFTKSARPLAYDEMNRRNLRLKRYFPGLNDKVGRPFDSHYLYAGPGGEQEDSVRSLLRRRLPVRLTYSAEERRARELEFERGKPAHGISDTVDRLARFAVAFIGGAFLLVPMIVMVLGPSIPKSLITTSAAVVLFAAALAFGIRATNVETMISTATYAAVLVVFVGTNTGGN